MVDKRSNSRYFSTIYYGCFLWQQYIGGCMPLVKKTIELDQESITRIKTALNAKSEKEAINYVLQQFDTDVQLAEVTMNMAGKMNIENIFRD